MIKALKQIKLSLIVVLSLLLVLLLVSCTKEKKSTSKKEEKKQDLIVDVIADYGAKGNGIASDRAAIQKAIDEVNLNGGGTVVLTAGHTFLSGNLLMRSNVKLLIDDNACLLQNPDVNDYIEVRGYDYGDGFVEIGEHYIPYTDGVNMIKEGKYADIWPGVNDYLEAWHWNYPFIYADKGTENICVTGGENAIIKFAEHGDSCKGNIHMNGFGYYRVTNFEVSNLTIYYTGQHLMDYICCNEGLVYNVFAETKRAIGQSECRMNDGIHIDRCKNILVENCTFASGDDSFKVGSSYGDIRRDRWASSTDYQTTENIEVSNVNCPGLCSGFAFVTIAGTAPDISEVEMRNIYVHDCNFAGVKVWGQNTVWLPDRSMWNGVYTPITGLRWENNNTYYSLEGYVHQIQGILYLEPISDCISDDPLIHSMTEVRNFDFSLKKSYWCFENENGSVAIVQSYDDVSYGYIGDLDKGVSKIYEGLYLESGSYQAEFMCKNSSGAKVYLFISDQKGNVLYKKTINSSSWETFTLEFALSKTDNYRIGIASELGSDEFSWAMIDNFKLIKK